MRTLVKNIKSKTTNTHVRVKTKPVFYNEKLSVFYCTFI